MTPDESEGDVVDVVRRGFEAFDRGDVATVLALADPEVEVYMPPSMPNGGTFRGHDGYLEWIGNWLEAWEDFSVEVLDFEPVGAAHVITHATQRGVGRGSGIPVEMDVWYLNEVGDGRFLALHLYPTHGEAHEVAQQRERITG